MNYDIIIIGGGIVGQTVALALAAGTPLSIAVLEARPPLLPWSGANYHHRVSAISLSSMRIFQNLNVWDSILSKRISPFTAMHVIDAKSKSEIQFDSKKIASNVLGYIIENNVIQSSLAEKINTHSQITVISSTTPISFSEKKDGIEIMTENQCVYHGRCVIAADGAHSWLRREAGIAIDQHDYGEVAIVATAKTTLSHRKKARQVFLENGPLAYLPLAEEEFSSIVWSNPRERADRLMKFDDDAFMRELQPTSFPDLGEIIHVSKRYQFPLVAQQAKQYVKSRCALVGDAAHTIHPLAGQGVNMGLLDAASLAEVIIEAQECHRDFSTMNQLRRYERWRRADNFMMRTGVHALANLFNSHQKIIEQLRSLGLNVTNRTQAIKNMFTRYAVGDRNGLPKLAK